MPSARPIEPSGLRITPPRERFGAVPPVRCSPLQSLCDPCGIDPKTPAASLGYDPSTVTGVIVACTALGHIPTKD